MSEKGVIMRDCIQKLLDENPEKPIDILPLAIKCTLDIICESAMGVCENILQKPDTPYTHAFDRYVRVLCFFMN